MVNGQIVDLPTTILAGEAISAENFFSGQLNYRSGTFNHVIEANYGWH